MIWDTREFIISFVHDTNAIEGSHLTRDEVEKVAATAFTCEDVKAKYSDDYYEACGLGNAIRYIINTKRKLTLAYLKELHLMVFENTKSFAGMFRRKDEEVVVGNHTGTRANEVTFELTRMVTKYNTIRKNIMGVVAKDDLLYLASWLHCEFERIHPFLDGNGRVGRLIFEYALLDTGSKPINITHETRQEYYKAIEAYEMNGTLEPFISYLKKLESEGTQ